MTIGISWGIGRGVDGREAAYDAMQKALKQASTGKPALALVFVSQEYDVNEVLVGLKSMLGNVPVWGIGTTQPLTHEGDQARSVLVGLLIGPDAKAHTIWLPDYAKDGAGAARQLTQQLDETPFNPKALLAAFDGLSGDSTAVLAALSKRELLSAGCLAGGDVQMAKTYQLAGTQAGSGGLAAAVLGGRLQLGVGFGHGWKDVGIQFQVTRVRDVWVQMLDNLTPAEAYDKVFGYPAREWAFPPLKEMVRMYPLGMEDDQEWVLRAPVHVEVNGSFRMNAPVKEGRTVRVMMGDRDACLRAAEQAAKDALKRLGRGRPLAALVFLDQAWQQLFTGRSGAIVSAVAKGLGEGIPIWGAYTLGQVAGNSGAAVKVYNENILVALLGERDKVTGQLVNPISPS